MPKPRTTAGLFAFWGEDRETRSLPCVGLRPCLQPSGALALLPPPVGPESLGPSDTPRPTDWEMDCPCAEEQDDRRPVRVSGEDRETRSLPELRPSGPVFLGAGCRVALVVFCASEGRALSPKAPRSEEETSSEDCPDPGAFEQSGGGWAAFSQ